MGMDVMGRNILLLCWKIGRGKKLRGKERRKKKKREEERRKKREEERRKEKKRREENIKEKKRERREETNTKGATCRCLCEKFLR